MRMNETINTMPEYERLRADYEKRLQEVEQNYQKQLIQMADEAKRANMAKTDFLRRMSHDMRTPINAINGYVRIAGAFPDDQVKQQECRNKILTASGYLLEMIKSVLDMSKLESGEMTLEHKPFQMTALLDRVCRVIKVQAMEEGIDFNVDNEVLTHSCLIGSPAHIQQILMNLLNNAVKYNRRGGRVWLRCREIADRPDRSWFEFVCEDTGIGMSEAYQQHIFEPFSQESDGVKSKYDGTGLGLPITKRMIELMGGTIDFWSQKNVGTRFTVRLPLEIDIVSCHYDRAIHADETANLAGLRALLVEDNEMNMEIAEFLLKEQHMQVDRAWNGAQAVELFEQSETHAYDIVLMDIMMPVMDGLEAARRIRSLKREDAKTVPIFAMSANTFIDDIAKSREAGMDEHFTKPLDIEVIREALGRYCGRGRVF